MFRNKVISFLIISLGAVALLILAPQITLAQTSSPSFPPEAFQRSIIFVDGTSVFYRFEEMKLCVSSFYDLFVRLVGGRSNPRIMRICWYTIEEKYERL